MLKIFADKNISDVIELLSPFGDVVTVSGRQITADLLRDADVLLVRTVTRVDSRLVAGSPVKFVGTATAGIDHIELTGLQAAGVTVAHAPGSNAPSVADYVLAAVLLMCCREQRSLRDLTCAVVGCGAVGSRVSHRLEALGVRVLRCDPPLHDALLRDGRPSPFVDTDLALAQADVATIHVPLHDMEPHATFGLFASERLRLLGERAWLINTSRGQVVNEQDLKDWLEESSTRQAVIDVWASEPLPDCDLVSRCAIASAHIAGYALEGKRRATLMVRDALADWIGAPCPTPDEASEPILLRLRPPSGGNREETLHLITKEMYDVERDDAGFRTLCETSGDERVQIFDRLRHDYPTRHEFSRYAIDRQTVDPKLWTAVEKGLGVQLI